MRGFVSFSNVPMLDNSNRQETDLSSLAHRVLAAFFATALRSSAVMVSRRRFPPIFPPFRPIADITRDMSEAETLVILVTSSVPVDRWTIWNAA